MINGYEIFLIRMSELYPDIYIQLMNKPEYAIKGWIHELYVSNINLDHAEKIKEFFDTKFGYKLEGFYEVL